MPRDIRVLRRLAAFLIRGPEAAFILADLDDALERELGRGIPAVRARWRYVVNVFGSAFNIWWTRLQRPNLGISWLDVKLGLRMLVKQPGLTVVAVFALAIGIPVGLTPTHAAKAIQAPLPVDEGHRIHTLKSFNVETSRWEAPMLYDFFQWREELTAFEALGALRRGAYNVNAEDGRAAPVRGAEVTASTFEILRVPPLLGRTFIPADEVIGAPAVVVIGYELWQSRLGGDPEVVGQTVRIGRLPHTVVGVMPEDFLFPYRDHLWLPLRANTLAAERGRGSVHLIFGRLSDGVSPPEAQLELATIGRRMAVEFPDTHERLRPEVVPFTIGLFGFSKGGLEAEVGFYAFQVFALLVLVVACANIAMLILARTATRSAELAVRTALGASRTRVVSQLFTESLVLAVVAAGVGLVMIDLLSTRFDWLLNLLPYWIDLGVSRGTVVWALSLAVFSAAVVGIVPALKVTGKAVQQSIQRAAARRSGVRFGGISSALIIADVTLAVATVGMAAGLSGVLTKGRDAMSIQADQFLSADFRVPQVELGASVDPIDQAEFVARAGAIQQALVQRLVAEPGVRGVAVASVLPGMEHRSRRIEWDGENRSDEAESPRVLIAHIDLDFFNALGQPILAGRGFESSDLGEDGSAVIVNTDFVDRVLGGRNAIGRRVRYAPSGEEPGPWYEVVGVVGNLGMGEVGAGTEAGMYHPLTPGEIQPVRLAIHVGDDPESFTPRLRALAGEVDPTAIISAPVALDQVFNFNWYIMVWIKLGAAILAGILLTLSASGIYALMSFTVAERRREIGIRTALGAQRTSVVFAIAGRAFAQLGAGVLLGMTIAGWLLFQLKGDLGQIPTDSPFVLTLIVGVGVMVLIGMLACVGPTLRALRIMPTEALRAGG